MKKNLYKKMFFLIFMGMPSIDVSADEIVVEQSRNIQLQFKRENCEYIIRERIDLCDSVIKLPLNTTLKFFDNGILCNGELVSKNTTVEAEKHQIFENITLRGEWSNSVVFSEWLDFSTTASDNNRQFANMMMLCNGAKHTDLYMQTGCYRVSPIKGSAPIILPSNVSWYNEATISFNSCDFVKYSMVLLDNVENVTIKGGILSGDLESHSGTTGEWGHGIKVSGSRNVVIENIICQYFWGDGIDLIEASDSEGAATICCQNVKLSNVQCTFNRRQGLSIEAAFDVLVENSDFSHTGKAGKTDPSAGIDIEPWNNLTKRKIENVRIINCSIHDNAGPDFMVYVPQKLYDDTCEINNDFRVVVSKCNIGFAFLSRVKNIKFIESEIKKVLRRDYSIDIQTDRCKIKKIIENK